MNKNIYNLFFILFIIILLYFLWYLTKLIMYELGLPTVKRYKEGFIPKKVKEIYRPIERNIRITYEGFYDKSLTNISNILHI